VSFVGVFCGSVAGYSEYMLVISPGLNFDHSQSRSTEGMNTGLTVNVSGMAVVYWYWLKVRNGGGCIRGGSNCGRICSRSGQQRYFEGMNGWHVALDCEISAVCQRNIVFTIRACGSFVSTGQWWL